jgi:hypothetical protein
MTQQIKRLLPLVAIPLAIASITACGSQGTSSAVSTSTKSAPEGGAVSGAMPAVRKAFGDYDKDDYGPGDDADNDDSNARKDRDNDSDNPTNSYFDGDDSSVLGFGHAASSTEARAITDLVRSYYAAAAARDGKTACALLYLPLAESVAEDLGQSSGPPYLRGNSCSIVMSKVFTLNNKQLSAYAARLKVSTVRIKKNNGQAVLSFKTLPGRVLALEREHGTWKIGALVDSELP